MAAIITEKFRTHNAKQFKEDIGESASSTYIFIGRSFPWTIDTNPPTPVNGTSEEMDAFSDMLSMKKITSADVSHCLPRYDWTTGVTYDEYNHDYSSSNTSPGGFSSLWASKFYVLTDDYNVYKCIRTGRNSAGATIPSTVKPTGTSATDLIYTSDATASQGYIWKYIYTVTAADTIKYVTSDFIPVKTLGAKAAVSGTGTNGGLNSTADNDSSALWDVENSAVDGALYHVRVDAAGTSYTAGTYTGVSITGDGTGATCTITVGSDGGIDFVSMTAGGSPAYGSGYKRASIVLANSGQAGLTGGSGAILTPVISPMNGHGADPVEELGGNHVIVNSRFEFSEGSGDFPTDNDFRRIGLVQDCFAKGTTTVATGTTLNACHKMTLVDASSLFVDDIIWNGATDVTGVAVSRIVSIVGNVVTHIPTVNSDGGFENFTNGDTVYRSGSSISDIAASGVNAAFPEVEKFTGNVLYLENRGAVTRAADQIEDIKLIIEM
jgi:hypothetical protein